MGDKGTDANCKATLLDNKTFHDQTRERKGVTSVK